MATPAEIELQQKGTPYRFFRHPGPVHSLEQAAAERGQRPEQIVRSLVFRISEGNFVMVLVAGPVQVNWKALRSYLGESRLTMAKPEEVLQITGYKIGAVSPFGLPAPIRLLVDENVFQSEMVSIGSGQRSTTIILSAKDLQNTLGEFERVHLAADSEVSEEHG